MPQEQEQKRIQKREDAAPESEQAESASKAQELKEEMDDIIDEIDAVLEQNAEEFVKSYVQKGGE